MSQELPSHLDNLKVSKSLIDLDGNSEGFYGFDDYVLTFVLDDVIVVEYVDEVLDEKGSAIKRNGIYVPTNVNTKAWRKGKVVMVGPNVKYCKKQDIVIFPNNLGTTVANVKVEGFGLLKKGIFLNEQRIFGIAKKDK
jgi:cellobiose-specific phosphotransferase system component IIB